MNCRSIGIEIISADEDFSEAAIAKAVWLTRCLQEKYDIPDANVIRHYEVTGKRCPAPSIEASRWSRLKARLCGDGTLTGQGSGAGSGPAPTGSAQELACRVIAGEFGNGAERRRRLSANYNAAQHRVNDLLS
ncbi:MAG: N-acetylmuramoyl-L-alanine amidase [Collinsella intestinalis]|nr:N-acetylmuramoyl-L-alanine amidase [Collinsella intestinalis]